MQSHLTYILLGQEARKLRIVQNALELLLCIVHLHVDLSSARNIAVSQPQRVHKRPQNIEEQLDSSPEVLVLDMIGHCLAVLACRFALVLEEIPESPFDTNLQQQIFELVQTLQHEKVCCKPSLAWQQQLERTAQMYIKSDW